MVGQQIGPYQILRLLGRGGMGIVYQGMHAKLEQLVAIKVLSPEFSENATMRERFVQEAKLQVKLSHPNVVNILNYLEDSRNIYLIMEYVEGENLEALLRRAGALPLSECRRITLGVLDALSFMHRQGIIHRDIKPSNIMITNTGQIKVTDFGIAKATGEKGLTRTGTQLGTVWYMSPEQIRGAPVNAGSDIYALGVTLFQMATGEVPFHSESDFDVMRAHVEQPPPHPEVLNPLISPQLADIILKALAKECADRFSSAAEFQNALLQVEEQSRRPALVGSPSGHRQPTLPEEPAAAAEAEAGPFQPAAGERLIFGRFEKRPFLVLVATASVLLALLIYFLSSSEVFKPEKKEPQHSIPLTSVTPAAPAPAPSKDRVKSTESEPAVQKSTEEERKAEQDAGESADKVGASPPKPTEAQTPTVTATSEQPGVVPDTQGQTQGLVAKGGEKTAKEIFDETLAGGDRSQLKQGPEGTLEEKNKAATIKKKSTRVGRVKEQPTPGSAQHTSDGSSAASQPGKGESKGWAIIK